MISGRPLCRLLGRMTVQKNVNIAIGRQFLDFNIPSVVHRHLRVTNVADTIADITNYN